jgi:hypothetical protein
LAPRSVDRIGPVAPAGPWGAAAAELFKSPKDERTRALVAAFKLEAAPAEVVAQ